LAERSGFASLPQPATGLAASANTLRAPSRSGHPSGSDPPEAPAESDVRRRPASDKERRLGDRRICRQLSLPSAMRCGPEEQPLAAAAGSAGKWLFGNPGSVANFTGVSAVADGESSWIADSSEIPSGVCHTCGLGMSRAGAGCASPP